MNRKLLIMGACALMSAPLLAQDLGVSAGSKKWDGDFDQLIAGHSVHRISAKGQTNVTPQALQDVIVNVSGGAAQVVDFVSAQGYEATFITDKCFTAQIPAAFIPTLAERDDVVYVSASREAHLLMSNVRNYTKTNDVHKGTDLDSPFDGTGVVVGVIDQGFQYNHIAFTDRVSYWTGLKWSTSIPSSGGDSYSTSAHGHATHVTNIAAGGKVDGVDYYGIAPGADILMVSSTFSNSDVLKQAKKIKDYAEGEGKPWVINMSFGSNQGPHDGTTSYDKSMAALCGKGGIMVAAMGNDGGNNIHAEADFTEDNEVKSLYIKPESSNTTKGFVLDLWGKNATGTKDLDIQLIIKTTAKEYVPTTTQLRSAGFTITDEVNSINKKQHYYIGGIYTTNLASILGITSTNYYIVLKVTGNTGDGYHAWLCGTADGTSAQFGSKVSSLSDYNIQRPNDDYLVGEGAASIPTAVAVASYNAASTFKNLSGATYNAGVGTAGAMSSFSSPGPSLDATMMKPACAAPGGCVLSAFNSSDTNVSDAATDVVAKVTKSGKSYYYGEMSGTSMASPVVTGIVALWLQANPDLDYDQILQILKETSTTDRYTGTLDDNGWNATSGYGKINAYEGLKKALQLKTGIHETLNSEAPVTFQKNADNWKVLFNNNESFARISIYNLNGQRVATDYVAQPRCGEEHVISLSTLPAGVYTFCVDTEAAHVARKMLVK